MERVEKLELIQRSLGIRHKLKVHDSMKPPETHEELALTLLARWELEDELRAIEELLSEERVRNVSRKRHRVVSEYLGPSSRPASEDLVMEGAAKGARPAAKKRR